MKWSGGWKRLFDIVISLALLCVLFPIFIFIFLVLTVLNGNAIFVHARVGRNGKIFPCYKLQTMVRDAEQRLNELLEQSEEARLEWNREYKLRHDPRVTRFGSFLRRSSIDELPQLWNVLLGDMSLVGPRPIVSAELVRYGGFVDDYLSVRPGITGLWQVSGRNETSYDERVRLDAYYARNLSFKLDLSILLKTFKVVLVGRGAY